MTDLLNAPKNIGNNKWRVFTGKDTGSHKALEVTKLRHQSL